MQVAFWLLFISIFQVACMLQACAQLIKQCRASAVHVVRSSVKAESEACITDQHQQHQYHAFRIGVLSLVLLQTGIVVFICV
jgi:hypothetical protein